MILVYQPDGTIEEHDLKKPGLKWFQQKVGGYINVVPSKLHTLKGKRVVVNEEGLPRGLPPNFNATQATGFMGSPPVLVGPVVVCDRYDV